MSYSIEEVLGGGVFEGTLMDTFNEPSMIYRTQVTATITSEDGYLVVKFSTEVDTNTLFFGGVCEDFRDEWVITHSSLLTVAFDEEHKDHLRVTVDSPFDDGELMVNWLFKKS